MAKFQRVNDWIIKDNCFSIKYEFMNQKDFDKKADTFRISNNLKEKLSKIYNS